MHLAAYGYHGGRISCRAGCTDFWLVERANGAPAPAFRKWARSERRPICARCHVVFVTFGSNAKRCEPCRIFLRRDKAKLAQRRHAVRVKEAARA